MASIIVAMVCAVLVGHGFREKAVQQLIEHGVPVLVLAPLAPDVIVSAEQGARARNAELTRAEAMATLALAGVSAPKQSAAPVQNTDVPVATTEPVGLVAPPGHAAAPNQPAAHHAAQRHATRHHAAGHHATRHHAARHHTTKAHGHHQPPIQARARDHVAAPHHRVHRQHRMKQARTSAPHHRGH